jgi:hypothetical protein
MNSIFQRAQKKNLHYQGQPMAAFGSISHRFRQKKLQIQPGPGAYEVEHKKLNSQSEKSQRNLRSRIHRLAQKGPTVLHVGEDEIWAGKMHVPVFGTQTSRFDDKVADLPPPGTYDISESFEQMKNKGRIENTGILASQCKREIFKGIFFSDIVKESIPGPGEYEQKVQSKKEIRRKIGAFLSTVF